MAVRASEQSKLFIEAMLEERRLCSSSSSSRNTEESYNGASPAPRALPRGPAI